jgi:putative transposase
MGTYRQLFYQIFFSTKNRKPAINTTHEASLYKYIWGIIKNKRSTLYRINGIEDDIHIMSDLHPSICLSDYAKEIKVASSLWMKASGNFPAFEGWQDGYGAFTYSTREKKWLSTISKIKRNIINRKIFSMSLNDCLLNTTSPLRKNICYKFILIQPLSGLLQPLPCPWAFCPWLFKLKPSGLCQHLKLLISRVNTTSITDF